MKAEEALVATHLTTWTRRSGGRERLCFPSPVAVQV
jgi:hypothetical protein